MDNIIANVRTFEHSEGTKVSCACTMGCGGKEQFRCTTYTLVNPQEVTAMEREVAAMRAVVREKDEALEQFLIGAKHESCAYAPEDPDPTWHCCNWSEVVEQVEAALSLTPASVAQRAEEATTAYRQTDDDYNTWECEKCHEVWCFNEGTPKDNEWRYCPKCGRRIVEVIAKVKEVPQ